MPILGAMDVVISLVVVLLVLSLVVQSVQQLVKKVLKLKSRTIETSLADLLGRVVTPIGAGVDPAAASGAAAGAAASGAAAGAVASDTARSAALGAILPVRGAIRRLFTRAQAGDAIVQAVLGELKAMGRRSLFNNPMLDSIAKDDVVKVLTKIGARAMYPAFQQRFQELQDGLDAVIQALRAAQQQGLAGSGSAKLASLEQAFAPLVYDLAVLSQGGKVKATAVLGDLLKVRQVKMQGLFATLGEVQDQVQKDLAAARAAGQPTAGLETAAAALADAARLLRDLGAKAEDAIAPLSAKLAEVDTWYDTVMQGFDERYTRHMKTVAVAIAVVTVLGLNASFFRIYTTLADDPALRGRVVAVGESMERPSAPAPAGSAGSASSQPAPVQPAVVQQPAPQSASVQPAPAQPAPAQPASQAPTGSTAAARQAAEEAGKEAGAYEALGFGRLHRADVESFWYEKAPWGPPQTATGWGPWMGDGLSVLFGWLITILLLSAGAPFWEDVLESLFGLKSLVRQKTSSRNVEEGSGGQPKP